ncbi:MAG: 2-hydroxyacyl-CoA dehydratase family protein [Candidatus Jordarchaeales archaeon]
MEVLCGVVVGFARTSWKVNPTRLSDYITEEERSTGQMGTGKSASPLEELLNMPVRGQNPYVKEWKEQGGLVFGFICSYVPEEIIYSMGILPIRAGALGETRTDDADVYLHRFHCTYARCLLQLGLTGEYGFLDGFVFLNGCDQLRRVYEIWKKHVKTEFMGMVTAPHAFGKSRLEWYVYSIRKLIDDIASQYALLPSETRLEESISIYNRFRELMLELYMLRAREKPLLSGSEAMRILNAAFNMPKTKFNDKLEKAIEELKQRPGITGYRARIMLAGGFMDDTFLIDLIEREMGALVVTDNLCYGRRYLDGSVASGKDLISSIAERYFYHNPCPRMVGHHKARIEFTKRVAEEAKVDGVIFQKLSFCDLHGTESQIQAKELEQMGIPALILEKQYAPGDEGRLKTRIQAFLERLGK